jgi:hypothetical protein
MKQGSLIVASTLLAPEMNSLRWKPFSPDTDFESMAVDRLVGCRGQRFFEAEANPLLFLFALIGAIAATLEILKYFGIQPRFASEVQYSQLNPSSVSDFRRAELRARQAGFNSFNGVSRSPLVQRDFSVFVAKDEVQKRAEMVTAYEGAGSSVDLRGWEPSIIHAALKHVSDRYRLVGGQLGESMAIKAKVNRVSSEGLAVCSYQTSGGGFILHDRRPTDDYPLGKISICVPGVTESDPDKLPVLWLQV